MTNILALLIVTTSTNWVPVQTSKGIKEVGIIVQDTKARVVWNGATNDYIQESIIVGQLNVRDQPQPIVFFTNISNLYFPRTYTLTN